MCLHGEAFSAGKLSRQTDFSAGSNTQCQRCHAEMRCHPIVVPAKGKEGGMPPRDSTQHLTAVDSLCVCGGLTAFFPMLGVFSSKDA